MSLEENLALERAQDDLLYVCGSSVFPEGDPMNDTLLIRQGLACASPIDVLYFASEYSQMFNESSIVLNKLAQIW